MRKILIIGATSAIAEATARVFAARGDALFLVARNAEHLRAVVADLNIRGAARTDSATLDVTDFAAHDAVVEKAERDLGGIDIALIAHGTLSDQAQCERSVEALRREFDINALSTLALLTAMANRMEARRSGTLAVISSVAAHDAVVEKAERDLGGIDVALIAHGTLSDQEQCQQSVDVMRREFDVNALSTLALLTALANRMEARRAGTLAVISSVAGDRGRQSNYVYGAAKAAVSTFLGGLRQRLAKSGVAVLTIKPGFVDTPMTAAIANKGALWAQPDRVAAGIVQAIDRRRNIVYLPWFWRWIMLLIRHIPEPLFKRLRL